MLQTEGASPDVHQELRDAALLNGDEGAEQGEVEKREVGPVEVLNQGWHTAVGVQSAELLRFLPPTFSHNIAAEIIGRCPLAPSSTGRRTPYCR